MADISCITPEQLISGWLCSNEPLSCVASRSFHVQTCSSIADGRTIPVVTDHLRVRRDSAQPLDAYPTPNPRQNAEICTGNITERLNFDGVEFSLSCLLRINEETRTSAYWLESIWIDVPHSNQCLPSHFHITFLNSNLNILSALGQMLCHITPLQHRVPAKCFLR